jgi:hypothetical protein
MASGDNFWRHVTAVALLLPALANSLARADYAGISPPEILVSMLVPLHARHTDPAWLTGPAFLVKRLPSSSCLLSAQTGIII